MRILYGIFAQGQGHFSKARVLVPLLEERGHEVRVISSGGDEPPKGYQFPWYRHFPGLSYVVTKGRTDYKRTVGKWVFEIPKMLKHLWNIRQLAREFEPDLVISDFEPLSANPFIDPRCEVVAISRQVALFDREIALPNEMALESKLTRATIRMFTTGADRIYGYHYAPSSARCVPPIIRETLNSVPKESQDHILVYNTFHSTDGGSAEELMQWSQKNQQTVKAYGFPQMPRGRQGLVEFCPPHGTQMLVDVGTAKSVFTTAGLSTPLEAFLLNKPVCVVPLPGHWEQLVNAFHLQQSNMATWSRRWNYDLAFEMAAPTLKHPLNDWLRTSPADILDFVLNPDASTRFTVPKAQPLTKVA